MPSLSLHNGNDGKVLVCCHAGCDQESVIAALWTLGLWTKAGPRRLLRPKNMVHTKLQPDPDGAKRKAALRIWGSTLSASATLAETYLASRRIWLPPPPTLRFHPGLEHPSGSSHPAIVALVTDGITDAPLGINRTFLARDGSGKAPVTPNKMMLGPCGGGAVRLANPCRVLMVGEGIETVLSAMQAKGLPAWAALTTSGLRRLDLPEFVREVIVLADADDGGEAAARDCALRWKRQGRLVRIAHPPPGKDFNDLLVGAGPDASAGTAQ
jgi:hypothetical protein